MNLDNNSFRNILAFFSKIGTPFLKFLFTLQLFKAVPAENFVDISFVLLVVGLCSSVSQGLFNPLLILKLKQKHDISEISTLIASFAFVQTLCFIVIVYFFGILWGAVFILSLNSSAISAFERGRGNIVRGTFLFNFVQPMLENVFLLSFLMFYPDHFNSSSLAFVLFLAASPIFLLLGFLNKNLIGKEIFFSVTDLFVILKQAKFYIYTTLSSEVNSKGISLVVLYFVDANIAANFRMLSQLASAVGISANSVLFVLRPNISASKWQIGDRLSDTYYYDVWKKYAFVAFLSFCLVWPVYFLFISDIMITGSSDATWLLGFLLILGLSNVIFGPTFIFTGVWAPDNGVVIFNLVGKFLSLALAIVSGYILGSIFVILSIFILGQLFIEFLAFKKLNDLFS